MNHSISGLFNSSNDEQTIAAMAVKHHFNGAVERTEALSLQNQIGAVTSDPILGR